MELSMPDFESYQRKAKAHEEGMRVFGNDPAAETPKWTKRTQILRDGLIALDCLELGMTRKEIANVLYGVERVTDEWESGRIRDSVNYLISRATALRDGGFREE